MLKDMKTGSSLKPGQKGTKALVEKYGDALLCVRYRYDEKRGIRLKTVEIVVAEKPWKRSSRYRDDEMVCLAVSFTEKAVRDKLKAAGGKWDPEEKLWRVAFHSIKGDADLERRIVKT